ncbi:GerAB/ArcD/ProY family transporter [Halanaerobaculum tunisiense]
MIKIKIKGQVTERQFSAILINTVIGVGILFLPRIVVRFAQSGGLVSVVLATLFFLGNLLVIIKLGLRFPEDNIFEYLPQIVGNIVGKLIGGVLVLYWLLGISLGVRAFSELIVTAILPTTPLEVIMVSMFLLIAYLVRKDIQVIGRLNELYVLVLVIPLLLLVIVSLGQGRMVHLFPLIRGYDSINILKGSVSAYFSLLGFEIIAIFIPHITTKKSTWKYGLSGWLICSCLVIVTMLASLSVFGAFELKNLMWPTFELIKSTQFFDLLFERLEVAFITIWVVAIFTTGSNLLFGAVIGGAKTLNLDDHRTLILPLLPLLYLVALIPRNAYELFNLIDLMSIIGLFLTSILPLTLLILAIIRGQRGRISNEQDS